MVSREHILQLGTKLGLRVTTRRARAVGQLLLLMTLVFVLVRLHSIWRDSTVSLNEIDWLPLSGAFLVAIGGVVASGFIWLRILENLGLKTDRRWTAIFFQAQLAKYIPGSVWQYAGRATLARARGLPIRDVALSLPIEVSASVGGAAVVSAFLLGLWGLGIAAAALLASVWLTLRANRSALRMLRELRAVGATLPLYAITALALGASFWLTANALLSVPATQFLYFVGAFSAAWIAGLVAIYAPGGIGVREAVLVAVLHSRLGSADALALAATSRAVMTLIDVAVAAVGFFLLRGREARARSHAPLATLSPDPGESSGQ
jgi:uncharacterized membrane protein YbhN (UPF0104 family)